MRIARYVIATSFLCKRVRTCTHQYLLCACNTLPLHACTQGLQQEKIAVAAQRSYRHNVQRSLISSDLNNKVSLIFALRALIAYAPEVWQHALSFTLSTGAHNEWADTQCVHRHTRL